MKLDSAGHRVTSAPLPARIRRIRSMTLRLRAGRWLADLSLVALLAAPAAQAQETPIKFQLDWRFEGPAALFLVPQAKGYYKAEKLAVTVDAGNGSGGTVTRV